MRKFTARINFFDYHHCSAKRDNIAEAETTDCLLLYLSLNSCRFISPEKAMVSLISAWLSLSGNQINFSVFLSSVHPFNRTLWRTNRYLFSSPVVRL